MSFKLDRRKACPVEKYARHVLEGKIVAGKWIKLAAQRHFDFLEQAEEKGIFFDREDSEKAIYFIEQLRHTKGEWAGKKIQLALWQKFIIGSIFGWKRKDTGLRLFKKAVDLVGRKNGKSTKAGGVSIKFLVADGEPGGEVYTVATKRDQAKIVFNEAKNMVRALPSHYELRKIVAVYTNELQVERTASKMVPLSSDDKTADGLNPSAAIIDELHAHKNRKMLDVIDTGLGARRQPFVFIISTAGFDKNSPCFEERDYATKVLEGVIQDDELFIFIAEIDEDDDPFDEKNWIKANPNLGISPKLDYLRRQAKKAKEIPSFYNEFMTKHMNIWTETETRWMPIDKWDHGDRPFDIEAFKHRPCFGGLDLSSTTDLSAYVKVWPPFEDDLNWYCHPYFWLPKDGLQERMRRDRAPYDQWARDGFLTLTDGEVIDHNFIQARVEQDWHDFNILDIGFDRFNATMMVTRLMDAGVEMVGFGQGYVSMNPAIRQMETLILSKRLVHAGHPILRWMCTNTVVTMDPAGNVKFDKKESASRIDGIVALAMGVGRANATANEPDSYTVSHGIVGIGA